MKKRLKKKLEKKELQRVFGTLEVGQGVITGNVGEIIHYYEKLDAVKIGSINNGTAKCYRLSDGHAQYVDIKDVLIKK